MTENELVAELEKDPFTPLRLHLVSGKVVDILTPNAAHTLSNGLVVFRNTIVGSPRAEGYEVIAYQNIESIELLQMGKRPRSRRKSA